MTTQGRYTKGQRVTNLNTNYIKHRHGPYQVASTVLIHRFPDPDHSRVVQHKSHGSTDRSTTEYCNLFSLYNPTTIRAEEIAKGYKELEMGLHHYCNPNAIVESHYNLRTYIGSQTQTTQGWYTLRPQELEWCMIPSILQQEIEVQFSAILVQS